MEKNKKSFVLYSDFEGVLLKLSIKERGMLFTMIYSYVNRGIVDVFEKITPLVDMAFQVVRTQLDRDIEKYEQVCLRNAKNGKLGGRPSKEKKTQWVFEKPKKADNDNETETDNDNDTVTVTDNDNELEIGRTFDSREFFAAALARSYGVEEKN